jgi:hypothetical protein
VGKVFSYPGDDLEERATGDSSHTIDVPMMITYELHVLDKRAQAVIVSPDVV